MDPSQEPKTKEDIKNMLKHLDDEYRKANISENTYKELKERYKQQMSYMDNTINPDEAQPTAPLQQETEEKKKGGFLGGVFKKKSKPEPEAAPTPEPPPEPTPETTVEVVEASEPAKSAADSKLVNTVSNLSIDLEKLKVMLEAVRDQKRSTDESLQSLFESIGEIRSMAIQNDATSRELVSKLEKSEDDINNLRPKEIEKHFNQISEGMEKYQVSMEKLQAKTDDMTEKLNKAYESLKLIGNTENLANLNQNVQKKLNDIREATNYVERLASKAEKIFIDLKMELEDLIVFKSKQEAMEDSVKDILKMLDAIGIKFEGYSTKKELEDEKQDIMILSKQQEDIKNVMAIVQTSVPEPILKLRKEREDIKLFLDSFDEQVKSGKVRMVEYETIKKKNIEKLKAIDDTLIREWKKFEKMISETPKTEVSPNVEVIEEKQDEAPESPADVVPEDTSYNEPENKEEVSEANKEAPQPETQTQTATPQETTQGDEKSAFINKVLEKRGKEEAVTGQEIPYNKKESSASNEVKPDVQSATQQPSESPPDQQNNPGGAQPAEQHQEPQEKKKKKKIEISMPF